MVRAAGRGEGAYDVFQSAFGQLGEQNLSQAAERRAIDGRDEQEDLCRGDVG
jgi:hypothetical protein